jgi:hypothetical protein
MGWRKRPPGGDGGYLEDLARGCILWPTLAAILSLLLVLSWRSRARAAALRSPWAAGGTPPHPGRANACPRTQNVEGKVIQI